jgi:D-glycero-alpha-D-manno-heptose-7-phosphate kinase
MTAASRNPLRVIRSSAPTRICDLGGWTDTWFAQHGCVLNLAVMPRVYVELTAFAHDAGAPRYIIDVQDYGERYSVERPSGLASRHPLIEAALECLPVPDGIAVELNVSSSAPPGASTGTSAALTVAILGALDRLRGGAMSAEEAAAAAHRVETEFLRRQCGIQDQLAAAHGGISFIAMDRYPHASVERLQLSREVERELESRLALVYAGQGHSSSEVHEMVIRELEHAGAEAPQLSRLRDIADRARQALLAGHLEAFGRCMIENMEAQRALHPGLIGQAHQRISEIAREHGALGWKVNGAGGEGGSVTLLCQDDSEKRAKMLRQIKSAGEGFREIPIQLSSEGLLVKDVEEG